jgi:hypothetical protein
MTIEVLYEVNEWKLPVKLVRFILLLSQSAMDGNFDVKLAEPGSYRRYSNAEATRPC